MAHKLARTLFLAIVLCLTLGLVHHSSLGTPHQSPPLRWQGSFKTKAKRHVFVGGKLSDEDIITFTTTVAASGHPGAVLLDTKKPSPYLQEFLAAFHPSRVIAVGQFPKGIADLQNRLKLANPTVVNWERGPPERLWNAVFPKAPRVVVCPNKPRGLLLHSAWLAGVIRAPLIVLHQHHGEVEKMQIRLKRWGTRQVFAIGYAEKACRALTRIKVKRLATQAIVAEACLKQQLHKGPIRAIVVANPGDTTAEMGGMSVLAPWLAVQKRALLLLTNEKGVNVEPLVRSALKDTRLKTIDALILLANLKAIPMERRPNPIPGDKDPYIEMEPLTPTGNRAFTFATGRLFNEDPAMVALTLARQRLLRRRSQEPRKALLISNPAGGLPLLEAFSRNTAKEFVNAGYQTTAMFGHDVNKEKMKKALPACDIFLWEGHHSTLIKNYCAHEWKEPLRPSLVFLQSCLALAEHKAQPFLERGALAIAGSSTRTYSASGGAFAMAFFDALHYDRQSLGGSLRSAKNFLLAYSLLKEKRLGKEASRKGANQRASWAFTLWGDPTLKMPRAQRPVDFQKIVKHRVQGNTIRIRLPDTAYDKVVTTRYQTSMRPNARMAGLLRNGDEDGRILVPFVFAEVHLPKVPAGKKLRLHSRIPGRQWVFVWDEHRKTVYLLVTPRNKDQQELKFRVRWEQAGD